MTNYITHTWKRLLGKLFPSMKPKSMQSSAKCPFHSQHGAASSPLERRVSSYDTALQILNDLDTFGTQGVYDSYDIEHVFVHSTPEVHERHMPPFRRALSDMLKDIGPEIATEVNRLLNTLPVDKESNLVKQFAEALPPRILERVMTTDPEMPVRMAPYIADDGFSERYPGAILEFFSTEMERELHNDGRMLDAARGTVRNGQLSASGASLILTIIWNGGTMAPSVTMCWVLYELLQNPSLWDRLMSSARSRSKFIEECLRLHPADTIVQRTTTRDCEVDNEEIPAGCRMLLDIQDANRDPRRFDIPDRISLEGNHARHLTFGDGLHQCFGISLVKLQLMIVLESLLPILPRMELRAFSSDRVWEREASPVEFNIVKELIVFLNPEVQAAQPTA